MPARSPSGRATADLFARPAHPYTTALLDAVPTVAHRPGALRVIAGAVPDLTTVGPGCRFAPRRPHAGPRCSTRPPSSTLGDAHDVACWLAAGGIGG